MEPNANNDYFFLQNGGECAKLIRAYDWKSTPLGTPENWPKSLQNTLAVMLSSRFPMLLWWGEDLIQFYNDAYRPSLGNNGKHPIAIGQLARECWPEIWDFIEPLIHNVLIKGESCWYEDLLLPIYRNGQIEDVYWTFSYSPVYDDDQKINGVMVICTETTEKINSLRDIQNWNLLLKRRSSELGTWILKPEDLAEMPV